MSEIARIALFSSLAVMAAGVSAQSVPWTQQSPSGSLPLLRERTFTATDGVVYYMYGGQSGTTTTGRDDLWSWNGTAWTQLTPSGSGAGTRVGGVMAYDSVRGKLVVFSGKGTGGVWANYDNQTWEWDATNGWVQMSPSTVPDPRWLMNGSAVYFPGVGVIFHGGSAWDASGTGYTSNETWLWVGTDWVLLSSTGPAVNNHSMVYRPAPHDDLILFGGVVNGTAGSDTYRFDLNTFTWSQITTATIPYAGTGVTGHLSYYNPITDKVIVHGGNGGNGTNVTWQFDGVDWTDISVAGAPSCRNGGAHWVGALNVGVAGPMNETNGARNRTWHHGPQTWGTFTVMGTDCPTSAQQTATISSMDMPAINATLDIDFGNLTPGAQSLAVAGLSDTFLGSVPLPIPFALILPGSGAGCSLQISTDLFSIPMGAAGTSATLSLPFPNAPSLVGISFYVQNVQVELGAPPTAANSKYAKVTLGEL
ncbi:MAG: hypothetical protein IPM29_00590 [Planctomycetes bacterium]|nr:hypothetical protein [Planctomycetota bacterium]